jgi:hypothetical protein
MDLKFFLTLSNEIFKYRRNHLVYSLGSSFSSFPFVALITRWTSFGVIAPLPLICVAADCATRSCQHSIDYIRTH